jgi:sn-glycerol 3-phosphate transport system substrate-binding protein
LRRGALVLAGCVTLAACGSGRSILDAGNAPATTTTTTTGPPVTAAPGSTLPPTTTAPTATTTTTPLASLPPCPVNGLDGVSSPVDITLWHGFASTNEQALIALTDSYNASQTKVHVTLQNQGGIKQTIDKYTQSSQDSRPEMVSLPEYVVQQMADSGSVIPVGACFAAAHFDTTPFLPRVMLAYNTGGVQWSMPFNVSDPVLYYNKSLFTNAGLDPDNPPVTLEELEAASQKLVSTGAAGYGIALDSGADSGGGWFLEQWFARLNQPYANNGNGRLAPATEVYFDDTTGVTLLTFVQKMVQSGLAVDVGDNPDGKDTLLKLADPAKPAAMTIASSAGIGIVKNLLDGGLIPGITGEQLGIGYMPGPGDVPSTIVGGASLYIVADKGDAKAAAAWDFITYLTSAQQQSTWASETGYVPIRQDALDLEPLASTYVNDPRFKVPYTQLLNGKDDLTAVGPVIGPLPQVRSVTAGAVAAIMNGADVPSSLTAAAQQADTLIAQYNQLNHG